MKRFLISNLLVVAILVIIVSISSMSCKKTSNSSTGATGTVWIHIHTNIDSNEVDDTAALYSDANGRKLGLSVAQFYISNVVLTNVNGSKYTIPNAHVLKNIDSEAYIVGTAPIGIYSSASFDVGLDDATNALQPTAFTTTGYIPNSTMWYGNTTQGYMFMKLQGFADTSAAQNGTHLAHFSYEIGSAANRKTVTLPARGTGNYASYPVYTLLTGGIMYVHVICDYGKLLSGVNFKTQDSTDTYTISPATATTIANNIPNIFHYEE